MGVVWFALSERTTLITRADGRFGLISGRFNRQGQLIQTSLNATLMDQKGQIIGIIRLADLHNITTPQQRAAGALVEIGTLQGSNGAHNITIISTAVGSVITVQNEDAVLFQRIIDRGKVYDAYEPILLGDGTHKGEYFTPNGAPIHGYDQNKLNTIAITTGSLE